VAEHVVAPAEQNEVVEIGVAAADPRHEVVRIAPAVGPVTTREAAVPVAVHQRSPLGLRNQPGTPSEVEDLGLTPHQHPTHRAVTRQPLDRNARDGPDVLQLVPQRGQVVRRAVLRHRDGHHRVDRHRHPPATLVTVERLRC
jgi:hypothetical protein